MENLELAYHRAKRGKGWQETVKRFEQDIPGNLKAIQDNDQTDCQILQFFIIKGGARMIGFPKTLNSKFDYEFVRENFPRAQWEPKFKALLAEKDAWYCTTELAAGEAGTNDNTHKVVESTQDGETVRYQYELLPDPNSEMKKIGYTEEELKAILVDG